MSDVVVANKTGVVHSKICRQYVISPVNVRIHILAIFFNYVRICFYAASATDFAVSGAGYCYSFIFPKFLYAKPL